MRLPKGGETLRHNSGDVAKLGAGLSHVWDTITVFLARQGWIPRSWWGKLGLFEAMSVAGAALKVNVKGKTVLSNAVLEIGTDAASEIGLRMFEMPEEPPVDTGMTQGIPLSHRVANGLDEITRRLNAGALKKGEKS